MSHLTFTYLKIRLIPYNSHIILILLGRNTLSIFALHQALIRIIRFVGANLFADFPIETSLSIAVSSDPIVLVLLVPIIILYNYIKKRYLIKLYI